MMRVLSLSLRPDQSGRRKSFTPLAGAYLADRLLGNKRAVLIGAALMAVGHFLMAFPSLTTGAALLLFALRGKMQAMRHEGK